jgi:hypothetical protein
LGKLAVARGALQHADYLGHGGATKLGVHGFARPTITIAVIQDSTLVSVLLQRNQLA